MAKTITVAFYDPDTKIVTGVMTGNAMMVKNSPNHIQVADGFSPDALDSWAVAAGALVSRVRTIPPEEVTEERNRRIEQSFTFNNTAFDYDTNSQANISGAATLAGFAKEQGATIGNYRWNGGSADFTWLAKDNQHIPLDAPLMFQMGQAAAEHVRAHTFAARALKDMNPIPEDYDNDTYWP